MKTVRILGMMLYFSRDIPRITLRINPYALEWYYHGERRVGVTIRLKYFEAGIIIGRLFMRAEAECLNQSVVDA